MISWTIGSSGCLFHLFRFDHEKWTLDKRLEYKSQLAHILITFIIIP